ncbi:MAG: MFS transporter, partial [Chloroflexota bacterium]
MNPRAIWPDYRGWRMVAALAITEPVSWGVLYYAFSALIVPMQRELGWSLAELTAGFSLATLVAGLAAIPAGRWVDRRGGRALMTAASLLAVAMTLAWSRIETLPVFLAVWAGIGLAQAGTLYEPAFASVAPWFRRYRSRAWLIITITAGFASTIFLPLTGWLAGRHGWRESLVILAVLLAAVTVPLHAVVLRRRPEDFGLLPDGERPIPLPDGDPAPLPPLEGATMGEALRDPGFWWLAAGFWLATIVSIAAGVHFIPYLTERGESPAFAAAAAGAIGAAQVLARLVVTALGGRLSLMRITAGVFLLQAVSVLLMLAGGRASIVLAVLLLG